MSLAVTASGRNEIANRVGDRTEPPVSSLGRIVITTPGNCVGDHEYDGSGGAGWRWHTLVDASLSSWTRFEIRPAMRPFARLSRWDGPCIRSAATSRTCGAS